MSDVCAIVISAVALSPPVLYGIKCCASAVWRLCAGVFFAPRVGSAPQYVLHVVLEHLQLFQPVLVETGAQKMDTTGSSTALNISTSASLRVTRRSLSGSAESCAMQSVHLGDSPHPKGNGYVCSDEQCLELRWPHRQLSFGCGEILEIQLRCQCCRVAVRGWWAPLPGLPFC